MAVAVTELIQNLKPGSLPKTVVELEIGFKGAFEAIEPKKPCVVMKRTDSNWVIFQPIADHRSHFGLKRRAGCGRQERRAEQVETGGEKCENFA